MNNDETIPSISQAFLARMSTQLQNKHITVKEMTAVLHALQTWRKEFKDKRLIIHGDNTGVVNGLENTSIRGPAIDALREMTMILALEDIIIESHWLPSKENLLADILSRGQWKKLANSHKHIQKVFSNAPH